MEDPFMNPLVWIAASIVIPAAAWVMKKWIEWSAQAAGRELVRSVTNVMLRDKDFLGRLSQALGIHDVKDQVTIIERTLLEVQRAIEEHITNRRPGGRRYNDPEE